MDRCYTNNLVIKTSDITSVMLRNAKMPVAIKSNANLFILGTGGTLIIRVINLPACTWRHSEFEPCKCCLIYYSLPKKKGFAQLMIYLA